MKFSSKVQKCNLSPIRKFYPYQVEAKKRGTKIYHLNIGQPDIETPQAYFDAIKHLSLIHISPGERMESTSPSAKRFLCST